MREGPALIGWKEESQGGQTFFGKRSKCENKRKWKPEKGRKPWKTLMNREILSGNRVNISGNCRFLWEPFRKQWQLLNRFHRPRFRLTWWNLLRSLLVAVGIREAAAASDCALPVTPKENPRRPPVEAHTPTLLQQKCATPSITAN